MITLPLELQLEILEYIFYDVIVMDRRRSLFVDLLLISKRIKKCLEGHRMREILLYLTLADTKEKLDPAINDDFDIDNDIDCEFVRKIYKKLMKHPRLDRKTRLLYTTHENIADIVDYCEIYSNLLLSFPPFLKCDFSLNLLHGKKAVGNEIVMVAYNRSILQGNVRCCMDAILVHGEKEQKLEKLFVIQHDGCRVIIGDNVHLYVYVE